MITLEVFAACVAEARRTGRLHDVLARHGLTTDEWAALKIRFAREVESPDARRRFTSAYQAVFEPPTQAAPAVAQPAPVLSMEETAAMPPPEEVRRMILEADPRRAIPRGPLPSPRAESSLHELDTGDTVLLPAPAGVRELVEEARRNSTRKPGDR